MTDSPSDNTPDGTPAPGISHTETALPEWVDFNGHMNVAYYIMVFDHATDVFLDRAGVGRDYRASTGNSVFVVEAHVTYENEVHAGEELGVTTRLLGHDAKRLHLFHHMYRLDGKGGLGGLAATNELMILHVDMKTRRASPLPEAAVRRIEALAKAQSALPRPVQAGRSIGFKAKPSAAS